MAARTRGKRPKSADLGSKRLVSLAPDAWVKWVTDRPDATAGEVLAEEFQWIGRESDVVIRAHSPACGAFAVVSEVQFRPTPRAPVRVFAYAGLASEKLDLPVFPVVVNLLPPPEGTAILDRYEANVMGLRGYQEYRVINLWEVDVGIVFGEPVPPLLPFVPLFRGGDDEAVIRRAVREVRADERLSDLEPLLAFFATFVLESRIVEQIMRWDMAVLMESPWYLKIKAEGAVEQARAYILDGLAARFGQVPRRIVDRVRSLNDSERLHAVHRQIFTVGSLEEFEQALGE